MKRVLLAPFAVAFVLAVPRAALADDPYALTTWGGRGGSVVDATSVSRDAPVTRAREMLTRARFLDEAATVDEKAALDLVNRLGSLRAAAKVARERAEKAATPEDRELLGAHAEDLET